MLAAPNDLIILEIHKYKIPILADLGKSLRSSPG